MSPINTTLTIIQQKKTRKRKKTHIRYSYCASKIQFREEENLMLHNLLLSRVN